MDVYVFNLTNAADVLAGVAAPNLAEVGPLRYQEVTTRINVSWSSDGSTLKYVTGAPCARAFFNDHALTVLRLQVF